MMHRVELASIRVPEFGTPDSTPSIPAQEYEGRIRSVWQRMGSLGLDVVAVYGDREHFANIAFLTGYDPRFEEALLILRPERVPVLLVGNEGMGYSQVCPIDIERRLYQSFSLLGQPRQGSASLEEILRDCGIAKGTRVGMAGWKYFTQQESSDPEHWLETPAYIVDMLRGITEDRQLIVNCTAMFMHPDQGLRASNSADQIALFEWGATYSSQSVRDAITHLTPGMTEFDVVHGMRLNGLPWSCHLMLSSGPRAHVGLPSPSQRVLQVGDPFFTAFGLHGGLTARAGYIVHGAAELPSHDSDYVEAVAKPYYAAIIGWWENVGLGVEAGKVFSVVDRLLESAGMGLALNPGHLLHLDEWVHSPFYKGSPQCLRSGMALQCDIIPTVPEGHFTANVEDGLALADDQLREELAERYPQAWARIAKRRQFMEEDLGMRLRPEVLPLSNWPAVAVPYLLNATLMMRAV